VEVTESQVELFVRDTGKGFEMNGVNSDRRGVSESIIGRMERAGGSASIHSEIGQGTEVELRIERSNVESD
jgi:signal transduction histidine kinase